jgi:hypothetical protein
MQKTGLNRTEKKANQNYGPGPKQHTGARAVRLQRVAPL